MYGKKTYGESLYGTRLDISSDIDIDDSGGTYYTDIERYMPEYITEYDEMHAIYETDGYELGSLWHYIDATEDQFYLSTATWGISKWEDVYGIAQNDSIAISDRRNVVRSLINAGVTTTSKVIEDLAYQITGTHASVKEEAAKHSFTVFFYGSFGIPKNIAQFARLLEKVIPAHLAYALEYRYTTWKEMLAKTWSETKPYTWEGVRLSRVIPFVSWTDISANDKTWKQIRSYSWKTIKEVKEAD